MNLKKNERNACTAYHGVIRSLEMKTTKPMPVMPRVRATNDMIADIQRIAVAHGWSFGQAVRMILTGRAKPVKGAR